MLQLNNVVLIFLLFISLAVSYAFAENPTPYNEWDFDSGEIEISQDPRNLDDMIILIPVIYKGDMGLGTVEISARVYNPDGSQFTHPQTVSNMEIGRTKTVKVTHRMSFDGTYIIDMKMTPPEKPYLGHVFDTETLTYVVEPNGREYQLEVSGSDTVEETGYHLKNPEDVKYYERISLQDEKPSTNKIIENPINVASSQIPDWIRNNASWWVDGNIDDKAFVGGIQFLIKEGVIQIPETTKSSTPSGSQEIPAWIKNNADWWSQGLISDDDFIKGIQFMVENGLIVV